MKILGSDDWLVFARNSKDELIYTIVEISHYWLDTPYQGGALNDIGYYNSERYKNDWKWMLSYIEQYPEEFQWDLSDYELNMSDKKFIEREFSHSGWCPQANN